MSLASVRLHSLWRKFHLSRRSFNEGGMISWHAITLATAAMLQRFNALMLQHFNQSRGDVNFRCILPRNDQLKARFVDLQTCNTTVI